MRESVCLRVVECVSQGFGCPRGTRFNKGFEAEPQFLETLPAPSLTFASTGLSWAS